MAGFRSAAAASRPFVGTTVDSGSNKALARQMGFLTNRCVASDGDDVGNLRLVDGVILPFCPNPSMTADDVAGMAGG